MKMFITGASSGFGAAIAQMAHERGYDLGLLIRDKDKFCTQYPELAKAAKLYIADVRDDFGVASAIDDFGEIDVLINSAGLALGLLDFASLSKEDADEMIDTNIKGTLNACRAAIRHMKKGALIINFGSVAGAYAYPGGHVYCGTKAFIEQFSKSLRCDFGVAGIRVSVIAPGLAKTNFSLTRFKGDQAKADAVYENTNYLSAQDIAQCAFNIIDLPPHVNINYLEVMPQTQSFSPLAIAPKQF